MGGVVGRVRAALASSLREQQNAEKGVPRPFLRARGDRGLLVWSFTTALSLALLLYLVLPTSTVGWDSDAYLAIAQHPLDNHEVMPFPTRLLVPFIVWILPFDPNVGFHITTIGGLAAGAVVVSFLARRIGVGILALGAAPAYVLSFHGIYGTWQWRLIDTVTVALFGAAILAAYNHRKVACSLLSAAAAASKEVGLTAPLAYFAARSHAPISRRRWLAESAFVAALPLVVFVALRFLTQQSVALSPTDSGWSEDQWDPFRSYRLGITMYEQWGYGRPLVQVFVQNHGMLFLLWPFVLLIAPTRWRRMHLYVLGLLPILAGGPWARSTMYLLPFILPSSLLILSRVSLSRAAAALLGSIAVAVPLALRNIGIGEFGSNLLLLPGAALFAVAAWPAVRRTVDEFLARRRSRGPDPATAQLKRSA
jgi:hypothetical protein